MNSNNPMITPRLCAVSNSGKKNQKQSNFKMNRIYWQYTHTFVFLNFIKSKFSIGKINPWNQQKITEHIVFTYHVGAICVELNFLNQRLKIGRFFPFTNSRLLLYWFYLRIFWTSPQMSQQKEATFCVVSKYKWTFEIV